ncbi:unnamed protein product [Phyllotreta striolata]|uniref:Odorant receptor n=1 Tax=Phyllotreta striolata TaxID=444603 RepID=A0A9N9TG94_PHYSR|nr:unnamed protein product [Phyllotreta striolata]
MPPQDNVDLNVHYALEKFLLTRQGFYPMKTTPWWFYLSRYYNTTISLVLLSLLVLYVFFTTGGDLVKLCENLLFFVTELAFVCKLINIVVLKDRLWLLERQLSELSQREFTEEEKKLIDRTVQEARKFTHSFRWLCYAVVLFYALVPLIDQEEGNRKSPLPIWVPFDLQEHYFYAWFFSISALSVGAFTNSNIDILTILYITIGTSQFEVLKRRFTAVVEFVEGTEEVDEEAVKARLRECVIYFDDVYSALTICMTGFQLLIIEIASVNFVSMNVYFSCMMCQIVMYCWSGNRLIESSDELSNACYSSKWYECSASVQKTITVIMERAKVPVKMRAAGFFSISLPTLMSILRTSYSYFAVLRHVYQTLYVNRE